MPLIVLRGCTLAARVREVLRVGLVSFCLASGL